MKKWLLPLVGLVALFAVYVAVDIASARGRTPSLIRACLDSSQVILTADSLSLEQLDILLRVEDPAFFAHRGIDLKTPGAGLTTITQSVGKWLYFDPFKPGIRKFRLMWLARYVIHPLVSKQDQLTLFLNYSYLGRIGDTPIIGLAQAAAVYYDKRVAELTRREYISLIGMYPFPNQLDPVHNPVANAERVRRIEGYLAGDIVPDGLMDIYYDGSRVVKPRAPK